MIADIDEIPSKIGIAWKEELKPLGLPIISDSDFTAWGAGVQINLLCERCNALLRRLDEQEKVMLELMKVR